MKYKKKLLKKKLARLLPPHPLKIEEMLLPATQRFSAVRIRSFLVERIPVCIREMEDHEGFSSTQLRFGVIRFTNRGEKDGPFVLRIVRIVASFSEHESTHLLWRLRDIADYSINLGTKAFY